MKNIVYSIAALFIVPISVMAESYLADGPNSYGAMHNAPYLTTTYESSTVPKHKTRDSVQEVVTTPEYQHETVHKETTPDYSDQETYSNSNNHHRNGAYVSLGVGGAHSKLGKYYLNGDDLTSNGAATSLELGYFVSEQFAIGLKNDINWGKSSDYGAVAFAGLIAKYYLSNTPDSFYLLGGAGAAGYNDGYDYVEPSVIVGLGYAMDTFEFEVDGTYNKYYDGEMAQLFLTVSSMFSL